MTHDPAAAYLFAENANESTEQFAQNANCPSDKALDDVLAAINAIPAVTVTDDMVERAVNAYGWKPGDNQMRMKAALVAALGAVNPPARKRRGPTS